MRIHECCLRNASFRGVVFAGVVVTDIAFDGLDGANFTDASINGGQEAARDGLGLGRLVLSPTQLMSTRSYRSKDLHECVIYNPAGGPAFDFRGADLRHSRLMGDFTKSDFTNARVRGATFELIALRFEQLASTYDFQQRAIQVRFVAGGIHTSGLQGKVDFTGIDLTGSKMGIPLAGVQLADARIEGCSLRLEKEQLYSTASYREGDLTNVQFNSCDLSQCNLAGMNLTGAGFSHCKFKGADFSGAVVTRAWFVTDSSVAESDQLTLDQVKSTWNYKHGRMKGIRLPESIAKALAEEKP